MRSLLIPLLAAACMNCAYAASGEDESPERGPASVASPEQLVFPGGTAAERAAFIEKGRATISEAFNGPLDEQTARTWKSAYWAASLMRVSNDETRAGMAKALAHFEEQQAEFQRSTLETLYAIHPAEFAPEVAALLPNLDNPKLFAMASYYLLRADANRGTFIRETMRKSFPQWKEDPILSAVGLRLDKTPEERVASRPALASLLAAPLLPGHPVLFSFQRVDRRQPGLAVIRDTGGRFVRREDGSIFSVPQLALAMSNLPGTITNGNTPQGIHSIRGTGRSRNQYIGPSLYLHSRIPVEASVASFFFDDKLEGTEWSFDLYGDLLPSEWSRYEPIWEAWRAGNAGRTAMLCHGTTVDPEFFRGEPYYPNSPTLGCLCTFEAWSQDDGRLVASNQSALVNAWKSTGEENGLLVLVEIDNASRPVHLDDVIIDLLGAEQDAARTAGQ